MDRPQPCLITELHVDDLALEAGASWRDAARLLATVAELSAGVGAQLSFRIRHRFAEGAARLGSKNPLRRLEAGGHEVGTHAHGRGLRRAKKAVDACGVANRGATPGMVQAGDRVGRIWQEVCELGFDWITDHPPHRPWAYGGLLPWRPGPGFRPDTPASGPVLLETSADPFAWGLLRREGTRVVHKHGLDTHNFALLEALIEAHPRPLPRGIAPYYALAIHEHNLCPEGSLTPTRAALDALEAFLRRHRVVTAGQVATTAPTPSLLPTPRIPRHRRFARRVGLATLPARRRLPARDGHGSGPFDVEVGPRRLRALWLGPPRPRGLLLLSHAGTDGGTRALLNPFGVDPKGLTTQGMAVVAFDRSGTGASPAGVALTPGSGVHVQDFRAVIRAVRARLPAGAPLGVMSFSSGILPPLRAGEPFAFLLDGEAPADRWTLRPPHGARAPRDDVLAGLATDDDSLWEGREPARLLAGLNCPYHRFQAELDHVHGRQHIHAQLMLGAAHDAGLPSVRANGADELRLLPGRLHAHGARIEEWILEAFEQLSAAR